MQIPTSRKGCAGQTDEVNNGASKLQILHSGPTTDSQRLSTLPISEQVTSAKQKPGPSIFGIVALESKNWQASAHPATGYIKHECVSNRMHNDHLWKHTVDAQHLQNLASFDLHFQHTAILVAHHNGLTVAMPTSTGDWLQRYTKV